MAFTRPARLALGAVVACVLAGGAAHAQGPSPSPTTSPSPTAASPSPSSGPTGSPRRPVQIGLAYRNPPANDPSRPCTGGADFQYASPSDAFTVVACTFDAAGMPAPTDSDGSTIRWRIENAHGRPPGVYFISSLPSETSATGAIAQAEIEAPTYPTHDDVVVELLDSAGRVSDAASVGISVTAPALPPRDVHTRVTMHVTDRGVGGRVIAEAACVANRVVTLHRRPDANSTVDSALTNRRGRWRLRVTRPGTYLARVEATSVYRGRQTYNCLSDRTFDVEITRQSRRH